MNNDKKYFFYKTFKISGVTFKQRQPNLRQLYEQHLTQEQKQVTIQRVNTDGFDCLMVYFNGLEVGVIPKQDVNYFTNIEYNYKVNNYSIGSFNAENHQTIFYARIFVHFFAKNTIQPFPIVTPQPNNPKPLDKSPVKPIRTLTVLKPKMYEEEFEFIKRRLNTHKEFTVIDEFNFIKTYPINNHTDEYVQQNLSKLYNTDYNNFEKRYQPDIKYNREEVAIFVDNKKIGYIDRLYDIDIILFKVADFSCTIKSIDISTYYDYNQKMLFYPTVTILFESVLKPTNIDFSKHAQEILDKKPLTPHSYYKPCAYCNALNPYFRGKCKECGRHIFGLDGSSYPLRKEAEEQAYQKISKELIYEHDLNSDLHQNLEILQQKYKKVTGRLIFGFSIAIIICVIVILILTNNFQ